MTRKFFLHHICIDPNDPKFWIANKNENVSIFGIESHKNVRDFVAALCLKMQKKEKNIQQEKLRQQ